MFILNGRTRSQKTTKDSKFTCIRYNGSSVVDYVIAQVDSLKMVAQFQVLEKLIESDHKPLSLTLNVELNKRHAIRDREYALSYCYKWNIYNDLTYLEAFNSTAAQKIYQEILCNIADDDSTSDKIVDLFYDMMMTGIREISGRLVK